MQVEAVEAVVLAQLVEAESVVLEEHLEPVLAAPVL
jgi:hypothetical protein